MTDQASDREHIEQLRDLIQSTFAGEDEDGTYRLSVRTARQIMELPEPPGDWRLLGPLAFRGYRTLIVGDTGHGKTTFGLQMLAAIINGDEMLGHTGAGVGPVLVIDLEQGIRSIKRGISEAQLAEHDDALWITVPDGLALDQEPQQFAALDQVIYEHRPVAVLLDPYYKAHRADDPNAERPIIDLMRALDSLRTRYGFALILPAHPRKESQTGRQGGPRKLTIHDIAGSGAITRGAEIVLGIERAGQGYARLRILKDRDGDSQIDSSVGMLYDKASGFHLDLRAVETDEGVIAKITEREFGWATSKEWANEIDVRHTRTTEILKQLVEQGLVAFTKGPPGRQPTALCYSTVPEHLIERQTVLPGDPAQGEHQALAVLPEAREHPGAPGSTPSQESGAPVLPGSLRGEPGTGSTDRLTDDAGAPDPDKASENGKPNPFIGQ